MSLEDNLRPESHSTGLNGDVNNLERQHDEQADETTLLVGKESLTNSVQNFFFPPVNPTIQRYYKFTASPMTPFAALHKRPGVGDAGGVTGLLRRSAVLPSHGTDPTGDWILVSVGGRSGWARKRKKAAGPGSFVMVEKFKATEGWMGNHIFVCGGKFMLGSDAPLFLFTNALIILGLIVHYLLLLPRLVHPWWLPIAWNYWVSGVLAAIAMISLWISATMDPGIIPAVSSPIRPEPPEGQIGGPLGYRYCSTCNIFRPPRSKHCNSCNVCVSKFDQ